MCIIQRRADSGVKSGKYVAAIYMGKQFFSTDYGLSFTEKKCNFIYLSASVAILEDTGDVFVATRGSINNIYVSRDGLVTTNLIKPNTLFEDITGMDITKDGNTLFVLGEYQYLRKIDIQTNTIIEGNWLNVDYKMHKLAVSRNGRYIVIAGDSFMHGSNDYSLTLKLSKQIEYPYSTSNKLNDMVMSGDGKYIFYSFKSASLDYNGIFRVHCDDWDTVDRISVAEINNYYIPTQICVSHTGKYIILIYGSSQGNWISRDFGRSFTRLVGMDDATQFVMSSNGKYIYCINGSALYRSADYGNTFSLALSGINSSYMIAISK